MKYKTITILIVTYISCTIIASEYGSYPSSFPEHIVTLIQESNPARNKNFEETIPKWIDVFEKGDLLEKQVALDNLWFLKENKYRKNKTIFDPILKGLKDKNPAVRIASAAYFKDIGERSNNCEETNIIPSLIDSLNDETSEVRKEAAKALAYFRDKRAVDSLLKKLQDQDPWVRLEVAFALGEIRDKKAILPLLNILYDDSDFRFKFVQQECLIAIRKIATPDSQSSKNQISDKSYVNKYILDNDMRSRMTQVLINKFNDPYLKTEIIKTIIKFNILEAETLLQQATKETDPKISSLSDRALHKLSLTIPIAPKLDDPSFAQLTSSLKNLSPEVRESSVINLGKYEDARVVDPLIDMLNDHDVYIIKTTINILSRFKDERILDKLVPFIDSDKFGEAARNTFLSVAQNTAQGKVYYLIKDGNISVVEDRRKMVGEMNYSTHYVHPHAVTILVNMLENSNKKAITGLLNLIWNFHSENFTPQLINLINDPSSIIRKLAITRLIGFEARNAIPYIINKLDDEDPEIREMSVNILGDYKTRQALEPLHVKLKDPKAKVRKATALALGKIKDNNSIDPLIKVLSDEDDNVVEASLRSLGEFNLPGLFDINIKMLKHESPHIRSTAVRNIIKYPDQRAVNDLILLLNNNDRSVRSLSAEALGIIGGKVAVDALIKAFNGEVGQENRRDTNQRIKAAQALVKIGDRSAVTHLKIALNDNNLRSIAEWALTSFGEQGYEKVERHPVLHESNLGTGIAIKIPRDAVPHNSSLSGPGISPSIKSELHLKEQNKNQKEDRTEETAIKTTVRTKGTDSISESHKSRGQEFIASQQAQKTEQAVDYIESKSVQVLISALKDDNKITRIEAARELGIRKSNNATAAIIDSLNDTDMDVRLALIWALGEINDPSAVKPLTTLFKNSNRRIRTASFVSLGKIQTPAAQNVLINVLSQENDYLVRIEAADTLGNIGAYYSVPYLINMLSDKNEYIRQAAVRSLGEIRQSDAVEPLLKLLTDSDFHVRKWTIQSLVKINDSRAVQPLLIIASSDNNDLSSMSLNVLKEFKDSKAKDIMKSIFLQEYDNDVYQDRKKAEIIFSILGEKSILRILQNRDGDDKKTVKNYIKLMLTPPSSPLIKLGEDTLVNYENRRLVVDEISNLIIANKKEPKIDTLQHKNNTITAVSLLRKLDDRACIPAFIYIVKNREKYPISAIGSACFGLADFDHLESTQLLLEIVNNPDEESYIIRMDAATALGKMGAREAVLPLIEIMKNRSEKNDLRVNSINALGCIKDGRAVDPLINILLNSKEDRWVRVASAAALGDIGDKKAIDPLEETIKESQIRQASYNALKKIKGD